MHVAPDSRATRAAANYPSMLSLAVYFDRLDAHGTLSATRPGLMFRPPDHPGVLVRPAATVTTLGGTPGDRILSERLAFQRGKSCLLTWPEDEPQTLRLELYYLDVAEDDASDATQPGRGVLLGMATHVISLVDEALKMVCVPLCDLVGNPVATLYARIRSQRLGQSLYPHLMQVPAAPATAQSALPTTLPAAELRHPPPSAPSAAPPPAPKPRAAVSKPSLPSATVPIIADSAAVPRVPADWLHLPAAQRSRCLLHPLPPPRRWSPRRRRGRAACSGRGEHHGARSKRPSRFCAPLSQGCTDMPPPPPSTESTTTDRSGGHAAATAAVASAACSSSSFAAAAMTAAPVTSTAAQRHLLSLRRHVLPLPAAGTLLPSRRWEAEDTPPATARRTWQQRGPVGPAPSHAAARAVPADGGGTDGRRHPRAPRARRPQSRPSLPRCHPPRSQRRRPRRRCRLRGCLRPPRRRRRRPVHPWTSRSAARRAPRTRAQHGG